MAAAAAAENDGGGGGSGSGAGEGAEDPQAAAVRTFQEFTQEADATVARNLLSGFGWNVEGAVHAYFEGIRDPAELAARQQQAQQQAQQQQEGGGPSLLEELQRGMDAHMGQVEQERAMRAAGGMGMGMGGLGAAAVAQEGGRRDWYTVDIPANTAGVEERRRRRGGGRTAADHQGAGWEDEVGEDDDGRRGRARGGGGGGTQLGAAGAAGCVGGGALGLIVAPLNLVGRVVSAALSPVSSVLGLTQTTSSEADSRSFITSYEHKYGRQHPEFFEGSHVQAIEQSHSTSKLLLVYFHSPVHEDTPQFCRNTFANDNVVTFVNENFICWGGSMFHSDAYDLSSYLRVCTFPSLVLLMCESPRKVHVVEFLEGILSSEIIMERLAGGLARAQDSLDQARAVQVAMEEDVRLRAEQEAEYQQALEQDRRRQEEQERQQEEEARAAKEEEERRLAELEAKRQREDELEQKRAYLKDEPSQSGQGSTTRLRIQLPNGAKLTRRFLASDTIETVQDYVSLHYADQGNDIPNFVLTTNYPKRTFDQPSLSLEEAELCPQAMLFLHDLDA